VPEIVKAGPSPWCVLATQVSTAQAPGANYIVVPAVVLTV